MAEEFKDVVDHGAHTYSSEEKYVRPSDPLTLERLDWFMDQKLGLMMHWGPYSQMGIVESWALCDEDASWSRKDIDWTQDAQEFKREYIALNKTFNPVRFQPELWAQLARRGGFKYFLMTTKHHDGFCMYDSKYTTYKITDPSCPFHTNKNADTIKALCNAMRAQGLGISAYFSKADWHCTDYWEDPYTHHNRNVSYDVTRESEKWESFVRFTQNQVMELVENYGHIDVLWFDAGWVCRANGQDIRIEELMEKARAVQPWLLAADRTVGGICENFVTPEQAVPPRPLSVPWESCVTMGTGFAYKYSDTYKSVRTLIHLLVDIVAKGGNLALNIAPQPDGCIPQPAIERMLGMGEWLSEFGECIYSTRVCAPYRVGNVAFTQNSNAKYAILLHDEGEKVSGEYLIPYTEAFGSVTCLNCGESVETERTAQGFKVKLAPSESAPIAHVFKII